MIKHSEAITAWDEVFQPLTKESRREQVGDRYYTDYVNVKPPRDTTARLPYLEILRDDQFTLVLAMSELYKYFKTLEGTHSAQGYHQARNIWGKIFPLLPYEYRQMTPYQTLEAYFNQSTSSVATA